MSANFPAFLAHGAPPRSSSSAPAPSSSDPRDDAKRNMLKSMRPLPLQHYWDVYFDGLTSTSSTSSSDTEFPSLGSSTENPTTSSSTSTSTSSTEKPSTQLLKIGEQIESVQDFWRYNNNLPVPRMRTRESVYLFKSGFRPVWEDRRNVLGGSWTFRVPKAIGPEFWTRVQVLAIGETLEDVIDSNDQICGVGVSIRLNNHLITIWHRDSFSTKSKDALLKCVLDEMPPELQPKKEFYYYKRHAEHAGFNPPPELRAVLDSQLKAAAAAAAASES